VENVFISGCGDIGIRVAKRWMRQGCQVRALSRTEQNDYRLRNHGIEPVRGDLDILNSLPKLSMPEEILYYFVPPPNQGKTDLRIKALLESIDQQALPKKVVLISTTAVYGDCQGEWISEDSPTHPSTDRGKRRLAAERILSTWAGQHGLDRVILRVAGIYGPGRLPIGRIKEGMPMLLESESPFSNRIHADDLAKVAVAAGRGAIGVAIYNVTDGQPRSMTQFFKAVAQSVNLTPPKEIDWQQAEKELSAGMLSYLSESKRVKNQKMLRELSIELRYPDFRLGLEACKNQTYYG
jgi:nucleoside-diphosphate-sugar epimerase